MSGNKLVLSGLYVFALAGCLFLLDIGLEWFLNDVLFGLLDWFNRLGLILKILLFAVGGVGLLYLLFGVFSLAAAFINELVLQWFPVNLFTVTVSVILVLCNAVLGIIELWRMPEAFGFWIVLELLLLSYFVFHVNWMLVLRMDKVPSIDIRKEAHPQLSQREINDLLPIEEAN